MAEKSRPLGGILLERGALDAPRHALLEALVGEHLKQHGGDPEQSLAALAVGGSTRELLKGVDDPDLDASLAHAGATSPLVRMTGRRCTPLARPPPTDDGSACCVLMRKGLRSDRYGPMADWFYLR